MSSIPGASPMKPWEKAGASTHERSMPFHSTKPTINNEINQRKAFSCTDTNACSSNISTACSRPSTATGGGAGSTTATTTTSTNINNANVQGGHRNTTTGQQQQQQQQHQHQQYQQQHQQPMNSVGYGQQLYSSGMPPRYGANSGYGYGYGSGVGVGGAGNNGFGYGYGSSGFGVGGAGNNGFGYGYGSGVGAGGAALGYSRFGGSGYYGGSGLPGLGYPGDPRREGISPLGSLHWLTSFNQIVGSIGQITELLGMNAEALSFCFGSFVNLVERLACMFGGIADMLSPQTTYPPGHPQHGEAITEEEEQRRIRRLRIIRFIFTMVSLYIAQKGLRKLYTFLVASRTRTLSHRLPQSQMQSIFENATLGASTKHS